MSYNMNELTCFHCKKNQDCVSHKSGNKKICGLFTENIEYINKSCSTCRHSMINNFYHHPCVIDCIRQNKWEPKYEERADVLKSEEKMDKIQLTEEQARKIYHCCISTNSITGIDCFVNGLKQAGYIEKNIVEISKELYDKYWQGYHNHKSEPYYEVIFKQHDAICFLENEIKKLRGQQ